MSSAVEAAVVSPIWDCIRSTFCFFISVRADYFDDLEANLKSLIEKLEDLEGLEEQIKSKVERERGQLQKQADDVTRWRKKVDRSKLDARIAIKEAKEEIKDKLITWFCPKTFLAYNRVGKRVSSILKDITELINGGNFQIVVEKIPHNLMNEMPMPHTVGLQSKFDQIWKWIEDPAAKIIGLYGTGGVGKTTLLKYIYNAMSYSRDFVVIWVEMPKQDPVEKVQGAVFSKFEITRDEIKNKNEADNVVIWNLLRDKKFFLLLDDVEGQRLPSDLLEKVGIPIESNGNGSKVIFTARAKEVCDRMRAKSIEVKPLSPEDALELLELYVGHGTLNTHLGIQKLAKDAVDLCKGLPLLLITIGRAMASKTNLRDWKAALEKLTTDLSKFPGVEANVLSVLKVSYDTLSDETIKRCFRYFSVFQEVRNIKKEELIELWIAEGLLEESLYSTSLYDVMEEAGEEIIASLKLASLLEGGESEDFVKMHDLIHSMALWLAHEEDKVLVQEKALDFSKWVSAERISIYGARIESLNQTPFCSHLTTLLLRAMNLKMLPGGLFKNMPTLRVLDLSDSQSLAVLPVGEGELGNLNYLNLSRTSIQKLPIELKNLKNKLQILIVSAPLRIVQSLKRLFVIGCPELRRLPFDSDSAENLMALEGRRDWWDNLQWESKQEKEIISLKFRPILMQKIVIALNLHSDKCGSKALKIAASNAGVFGVALDRGKNQMVVTGDGIDVIKLVISLRRKLAKQSWWL